MGCRGLSRGNSREAFATAHFDLPTGTDATVRVRLPRTIVSQVKSRGQLTVTASAVVGTRTAASRTVKLKAS